MNEFKISKVENYDLKYWRYTFNKLEALTFNRFHEFYENHILKDQCLFDEFASIMSRNFGMIDANWDIINTTDMSMMFGGWSNGEISQFDGIGSMLSPGHGVSKSRKSPWETTALTDELKSYLIRWGLNTRVLNRYPCCIKSCRCGVGCGFIAKEVAWLQDNVWNK